MNDNPWLIAGIIDRTKDMAKELGLRIEPGSYNNIEIMADNPPYGKNVMLAKLDDWATANLYLQGYRQGKLEMTALAKGKKAKPKEPEHIDSETCWCKPELDYTDPDTGVSVYVHRRVQ